VSVTLMTAERSEVLALAFLVERAHPSYAGALPLGEQARLIRGAAGRSGNNIDYLLSTLAHLSDLGIRERPLERLLALVGSHLAHGAAGVTRPNAVAMLKEHRKRHVRTRPFHPADAHRFCYRSVLGAV
jgi:cation transport protein ChaC